MKKDAMYINNKGNLTITIVPTFRQCLGIGAGLAIGFLCFIAISYVVGRLFIELVN